MKNNNHTPKTTYLVFAPRRSGHHAILNWMSLQLSMQGDLTHYNNINLPKLLSGSVIGDGKTTFHNGSVVKDISHDEFQQLSVQDTSTYRVFNFEDRHIENFRKRVKPSPVTRGQKVQCVVILRDPFNNFASFIKCRACEDEQFDHFRRGWIQIAQEFLGISDHLPKDTVFVNYNEWVKSEDYRRKTAKALGINEFDDQGLELVPRNGGGSSFTGVDFNGKAQKMDVFSRWKMIRHKEDFKQAIDLKVDEYSKKIFGIDWSSLKQTLGGKLESPYVSIQHPCQTPITVDTCLERTEEYVKHLHESPEGDVEAQMAIKPDAGAKMVNNYKHVFENRFKGRGIVICAGGGTYLPPCWVLVNQIRRMGCDLPIQIWYKNYEFGVEAPPHYQKPFLDKFDDVVFINGAEVRTQVPCRMFGGWEMKAYAIINSNFREVISLDADNIPLINLEDMFETEGWKNTKALFWPDRGSLGRERSILKFMDIEWRKGDPEWESGQIFLDKVVHWKPIMMAMWMNSNSDFFYKHFHGDKETFHLAWRKLAAKYTMHPPMKDLTGWDCICQHNMEGDRIFQHRNGKKYNLKQRNPDIKGFVDNEAFTEMLAEYRAKVLEGGPMIR